MNGDTPLRIAGNRLLYFALGVFGIFVLLVPISMVPNGMIWPQVMLMVSMALVIRNPVYVPFWLIGFLFLISDILLAHPMGLGAFIALLACEFLRRNRPAFVEMLFFGEWFSIGLILLAAGLLSRFLLVVTFAETTPWWAFMVQLSLSILVYPLVVGAISVMFKVSKVQETISHPVRRPT